MREYIHSCRRFLLLSRFERIVAFEAMLGLAATRMGLWIAGFQRWKSLMAEPGRKEMGCAGAEVSVESVARIADLEQAVARRWPFRTNCLEQSLVLLWLLRRRGIPAELRIGARKDANRFEAHAWVEFEGAILNDVGNEHLHFVPFEGPASSLETQTH